MDPSKETLLWKSMYLLKIIQDGNLLSGQCDLQYQKEIQELREEYDGFILGGGKNVHHSK